MKDYYKVQKTERVKLSHSGFQIGDKVRKNPSTWIKNEFDSWGRGDGVGEIVKPPFELDDGQVDVKWPNGRCFEQIDMLLPADLAKTAANLPPVQQLAQTQPTVPGQPTQPQAQQLVNQVSQQGNRLWQTMQAIAKGADPQRLGALYNLLTQTLARATGINMGKQQPVAAGFLTHLVKSAAELEKENTVESIQAVEGIDAVLLACEAGIVDDAKVLDTLVAVAGYLDQRGEAGAADILDKISLAYVLPADFPESRGREETRKDMYDADAHNKSNMWEHVKTEVGENRKQNSVEPFGVGAPSLSTRYSPDLPGVPLAYVSDQVYQDVVTKKIYDFRNGYTLADGTKVPGGSPEHQTPNTSQYSSTPRIFDSRQDVTRRRM